MPNWCWARITVAAPKESIALLYSEMGKALSSDPCKTDFGNEWLGNLLYHIGMLESAENEGIRHRGSVEYFDKSDEDLLYVETESAWGPAISCIEMFVNHYVDDAKILYEAEEPGMSLYWTNDPYYLGKVIVDSYNTGEMPEELFPFMPDASVYLDRAEVVSALQKILETEEQDLTRLVEAWNKKLKDYDEYADVDVYPFELVEIGEDT